MLKQILAIALLTFSLFAAAQVKVPSRYDIALLRSTPTDTICENFDAKYGDGSAARYINEH